MTKEDDMDIEVLSPGETFSDHVAARADAFGQLALRMEEIEDEKVRELCFQMLRQLIRSIKTPPDAELMQITGGKP
jgi:phosphate uptake regulator